LPSGRPTCQWLDYGALAPPVGLAGADSFAALSLDADFSFSAAAPPEAPAVLGAPALEGVSLVSLAGASALEEELSLALLVVLVDVVEVEVLCTAAASALVSVGGVISGVLFGTASETLLEPHALSVSPASSAAHAASATRALTAVPCACRTWGSR
jgi:hypothetical protein